MAKSFTPRRHGGSMPGERRGGRQKGTPNKTTQQLRELLKPYKDPAIGLAEVSEECARRCDNSSDEEMALGWKSLQQKCYKDLMPYLYPQRKAVDMDINASTELPLMPVRLVVRDGAGKDAAAPAGS